MTEQHGDRRWRRWLITLAVALTLITAVGAALQPRFGVRTAHADGGPPGTNPVSDGWWDSTDYQTPQTTGECPQPPQDLNVRLALTDTQLASYGLPTHADIPDTTDWTNQVTADTTRKCTEGINTVQGNVEQNGQAWMASRPHKPANALHATIPADPYGGTRYSNRWAGWLADGGYLYPQVSKASANFNVPCTDHPAVGQLGVMASQWVGVGGAYYSEPLIQAGVQEIGKTTFSLSYTAFWEYVPQGGGGSGAHTMTGWNIQCADHMYFYVTTSGRVYLADNTRNLYSGGINTGGSATPDSAEWIAERISKSSGCTSICLPLSNFHWIDWSSCYYTDTSGVNHSPTYPSYEQYVMTQDGSSTGTLLATQGNWTISGNLGSYRLNWVNGGS